MQVAGVELTGARVLVLGLARSGLAAIRLLRAQDAIVTASDLRPVEALPGVAESGAAFVLQSDNAVQGHELVVISPGVAVDAPPLLHARALGIPVIGELELASYFLLGPVIGITGSNGKTTTTALVHHILRECGIPSQIGGNIGTPPTSMVADSREAQWNVLEISSFQLETISNFHARIAVCLNITPDHLDRHGTMEVYTAMKRRLFETQREDAFAVLNADDPACFGFASTAASRPLWFSLSRPVTPGLWYEDGLTFFDGEPLLPAGEIPLRGMHNVENFLAAAGAARLAGASLEGIAGAVRSFPGVEHRLEFVRTVSGVEYFNDSKATNVDATLKAIDAFPGGLWIILGGKDKGGDYTPLRDPLKAKAKAALLIGAAARKIEAQLSGSVPMLQCGDLAAAVAKAAQEAAPGDVVLLAPACASFDQFDNFEHRGTVFKQLVTGLKET